MIFAIAVAIILASIVSKAISIFWALLFDWVVQDHPGCLFGLLILAAIVFECIVVALLGPSFWGNFTR